MKKLLLAIFILILFKASFGQHSQTYKFADRDTCSLYLDIYYPTQQSPDSICLVYIFGGGYVTGSRSDKNVVTYCDSLRKLGYTTIAIDYRLGLKGIRRMGLKQVKVLENAINMAAKDLLDATLFLCKNAKKLNIDPTKIVTVGSSAGAITALQADYKLHNHDKDTKLLPENFRYAGVIAFSGAIFSRKGKVKYHTQPAPTLFFHGTDDRLVTYKQIKIANIGFFGCSKLTSRFDKFDYPYFAKHYKDFGHEVAGFCAREIDLTNWFIDTYILEKRKLQINEFVTDQDTETPWYSKIKPSQLYREVNKN